MTKKLFLKRHSTASKFKLSFKPALFHHILQDVVNSSVEMQDMVTNNIVSSFTSAPYLGN